MKNINVRRKPFIVGVMGSHLNDRPSVLEIARYLGKEIAKRGCVLLTGGGSGVMKAASEGAYNAGGLVIGILPNDRLHPHNEYPNKFVDISIYTGMHDARNVINAKTPHLMIALNGHFGTLSEVALALNNKTPVISLGSPTFNVSGDYDISFVGTAEEVVGEIEKRLAEYYNSER